jgi:hypothetical protein
MHTISLCSSLNMREKFVYTVKHWFYFFVGNTWKWCKIWETRIVHSKKMWVAI